MKYFCELLPGADQPIQVTQYVYEDEELVEEELLEEEDEEVEIFTEVSNTNGDADIVRTLPQPPLNMAPLNVEVDPVRLCLRFFSRRLFDFCWL